MFKCPKCSFEQEGCNDSWHEYLGFPFICQKCGELFWIKRTNETMIMTVHDNKMKTKMPPLKIRTKIYLDNKDHKFYLSPGMIVAKDHVHYRVKLYYRENSMTKHTFLWCPESWIKPMPDWI